MSNFRTATIDLCSLLLWADRWHFVLRFLIEDGIRLEAYSYLPRKTTRQALRRFNLLEYFDNITYNQVPEGEPLITPYDCLTLLKSPRAKIYLTTYLS